MDDGQYLAEQIGLLYECATDGVDRRRIAATVFEAMGVESGIMFITEHPSGEMIELVGATANLDGGARADYRNHFHAINPWYGAALDRIPPYVARGEELIADEAFLGSEFYNDWCRRIGIRHMIGGTMPLGGGVVVGTGIHRRAKDGFFKAGDVERYHLLLRHLTRALQLSERLKAAQTSNGLAADLLTRLGNGMMLLDADERILIINTVAERLCRHSRWFAAVRNIATPINHGDRTAFASAVAAVCRTSNGAGFGAGTTLAVRDPIEGALPVLVAPFRSPSLGYGRGRSAAIVLFRDPDATPAPGPEGLQRALGLTPAEARLLVAVADGRGLSAAADEIGVSLNTAKTHLRAIFAKTGTSRQAELTALVAQDPILRWDVPQVRA